MHTQRPAAQIFSAVLRVFFRAAAFFLDDLAHRGVEGRQHLVTRRDDVGDGRDERVAQVESCDDPPESAGGRLGGCDLSDGDPVEPPANRPGVLCHGLVEAFAAPPCDLERDMGLEQCLGSVIPAR